MKLPDRVLQMNLSNLSGLTSDVAEVERSAFWFVGVPPCYVENVAASISRASGDKRSTRRIYNVGAIRLPGKSWYLLSAPANQELQELQGFPDNYSQFRVAFNFGSLEPYLEVVRTF